MVDGIYAATKSENVFRRHTMPFESVEWKEANSSLRHLTSRRVSLIIG
jgi:hypothetical protein